MFFAQIQYSRRQMKLQQSHLLFTAVSDTKAPIHYMGAPVGDDTDSRRTDSQVREGLSIVALPPKNPAEHSSHLLLHVLPLQCSMQDLSFEEKRKLWFSNREVICVCPLWYKGRSRQLFSSDENRHSRDAKKGKWTQHLDHMLRHTVVCSEFPTTIVQRFQIAHPSQFSCCFSDCHGSTSFLTLLSYHAEWI